eukprot:scaffold21_cov107-Cylindrotheca_fusiformis.AAC.16
MKTTTITTTLLLLVTSLSCNEASAFLDSSSLPGVPKQRTLENKRMMFADNSAAAAATAGTSFLETQSSLPNSDALSFLSNSVLQLADASTSSPAVLAEVFAGLAHLTLDFTGMVVNSKSSAVRCMCVIFGRVFALSADYLPDHAIHPEELLIQLFLMCVAMREVFQEKEQATVAQQQQR